MYSEMYKNAMEMLMGILLWVGVLLLLWLFLMVARLVVSYLALEKEKNEGKRMLFVIVVMVLIGLIVLFFSISLGGLRF